MTHDYVNMSANTVNLRRCILKEFQLERNATEAFRYLVKGFGDYTVSDRTCIRSFENFEAGDFNVNDKQPRSWRPSFIDNKIVKTII